MENTLENKARFFALYWGQYLMRCKTFNVTTGQGLSGLMNVDVNSETIKENWFLELNLISLISDDDCSWVWYGRTREEVAMYLTGKVEFTKEVESKFIRELKPQDFDYLRSKGYALPWMGLSVEQLMEYGWVKLEENK